MPNRESARHRAVRSRRGLAALWGSLVVCLLLATGLLVVKAGGQHAHNTKGAARTEGVTASARAAGGCVPPGVVAGATAAGCAAPSAAAQASRPPPPPARNRVRRPRRAVPGHSRRAPASPSPGRAASPAAAATSASAAQQVLALINRAREQAGLPAYTSTAGLGRSAAGHTTEMASGCGLSHQCPGEPALGARETAAGVRWTAAGENIGQGGPVAAATAAIAKMAVSLTQDMLNEKPPDDGHRRNILSSAFHHIGVAIHRDGSGTVWLTQDFSD